MPFHPAAAKQMADAAIHACVRRRRDLQGAFLTLVHAVQARSQILSARCYRNRRGENGVARNVEMLLRIAECVNLWQRRLWEWCAPEASQYVQVRSLVNHLFAKYPVPGFMTKVWFLDDSADHWRRRLFLHLGLGRSARSFPLPIRMTKAMARQFMVAPDDLSVPQAVRWAQVMALGGNEELSRSIVGTCLGNFMEDEKFWETVVRFVVRNQPVSRGEVEEIVRFVYQQRVEPAYTVLGFGADRRPLQPNFSLRGRTLRSLRRYMDGWRERTLLELTGYGPERKRWEGSDIGALRFVEDGREWTIEEVLSDRELRIEGRIMKHCVALYIPYCARRWTSIWSMKVNNGERRRRVLTIEVNPQTKTVKQARGRRNAAPDAASRAVLLRWARQEGLKLML